MNRDTLVQTSIAIFFLCLALSGAWLGIWNQDQIQSCEAQYDDDPNNFVDCKDQFTDIVRGVSLLGLIVGGGAVASILYRRYR
ncbi:hypothetical protein [Haloferax sp. DFSO60]|uniref:hypothetical protein n=1 Tax=Haloferax sp. DFSO60 TaxID=3388652 RepID=UPI00397D8020